VKAGRASLESKTTTRIAMFGKKKKPQQLVIEIANSDKKKPSEPEIRANKFVLTDTDGATRAQFQCSAGGAVALTFHDDAGKMGVLLGLDPNQNPTLAFVRDGHMKANLDIDNKTEQPSLTLHGSGKSRVEVGFDKTDNASLRMTDEMGNVRASISLSAKGDAQIKLFDNKGYVVNEVKSK
jgi:hypothetical protein